MNQKITDSHLDRWAVIYIRQSTPSQVRLRVESAELQRKMTGRAEQLGWARSSIHVMGGDTGRSGASLNGREDYQRILKDILNDKVGLFMARELSRLVRDNQDFNDLIRICRFKEVLLGDEHRIYHAGDTQDRILLGIQGTFNEFELSVLKERMHASRRQKAERGELHESFPPGYISRHSSIYEKHPDTRVQRAIEKVFHAFEKASSVYQLHKRLSDEKFVLPEVPRGQDWREVRWVEVNYERLLAMLKNPTYCGMYVHGRTETVRSLDEKGHLVRKTRAVKPEHWRVRLEGHHEGYISMAQWHDNQKKIANNSFARGKGAPREGCGLVVGLLRCRRCGRKLYAAYPSDRVQYSCRGNWTKREKGCFSFSGKRPENALVEELLFVLGPVGLEAARRAEDRWVRQRQANRQLLVDRVNSCEEKARRAERECLSTDPAFLEVRRVLTKSWNEALVELEGQKQQLEEFDSQQQVELNEQQRQSLHDLGAQVEQVWHHPRTRIRTRKEIVRLLVEEIIVDLDEATQEIVWVVHWAGGHHTEIRVPRRMKTRSSAKDLIAAVNILRKVLDDQKIAVTLNRHNVPSPTKGTWNKTKVRAFRKQHGLKAFDRGKKEKEGWLTQAEAATQLSISPMSVSRLIKEGVLAAEKPGRGLPATINQSELDRDHIKTIVKRMHEASHRPLTDHPNQLTLW